MRGATQMIVTTFTPWGELLARADAALTEERKAQALAEPFALLESLMQVKIRKWAGDRRQRMNMKQGTRSRGAFSIPALPAAWPRVAPELHARL